MPDHRMCARAAAADVRQGTIAILAVAWMLCSPSPSDAAQSDTRPELRDTAIALTNVVTEVHYLGPELEGGIDSARLARAREAYLRALDPHGDLLLQQDVLDTVADEATLAAALTDGQLGPVLQLSTRQIQRSAERMDWVAQWLAEQRDDASGRGREDAPRCAGDATAPLDPPPHPLSASALDAHWHCRLTGELEILIADGRSRAEGFDILQERYQRLGERTAARTDRDSTALFLNAFLASLDPHSRLRLPATPAQRRRAGPRPVDLFGIGAILGLSGDHVELRRLLEGGAAERSGVINAGDRVLSVAQADGPPTDVTGWAIEDVVNLIRGPRGSVVTLTLLPRGAQPRSLPATVALTRDQINLERRKVASELLERDGESVGVIRVPGFYVNYDALGRGDPNYESAASDVARALARLQREAPTLAGIILDLRGNSGGALIEAVRMVGLFIDAGPVVRVRHAGGGVEVFEDELEGSSYDGPLAVLVDRYSASASEIVAAALQDYRRALIIGEPTYGKGSVQEPFDLRAESKLSRATGRVSLTTAEFFRVNGESTQLRGVTPEVLLPVSLTNGRYGERFEHWPLPAESLPPARYEAQAHGPGDLSLDEAIARTMTPTLWDTRPTYLREAPPPGDALTQWRAQAVDEREAFRHRIGEQLPQPITPDAPLPSLWAQRVLEDAITVLIDLAARTDPPPVVGLSRSER
jgi:carboxyl-terminal processing protease